ncbi:MAG: hypothetical protein HQK51_01535, partial [Oligoflexia bacterium]|nr:hypothetical protein [Oligoflexia bacterium]
MFNRLCEFPLRKKILFYYLILIVLIFFYLLCLWSSTSTLNASEEKKSSYYQETVGNKAANLIELQNVVKKARPLPFKVQVPEISPIPHETILNYLNTHAVEWKKLWSEIKSFSSSDLEKLAALGKLIKTTFEQSYQDTKFFDSVLSKFIEGNLGNMIMVRSTGKEDTAEIANPGGNESLPAYPNKKAIAKAIGVVVASYFSEKSLKQRHI